MKKIFVFVLLGGLFFLNSCGENKNTDVVASGTYQGVSEEVDSGEKEVYVRTDDKKLVELYFTDQTKLMRKDGEVISFDKLKENKKIEITVEKQGNKDVPVSVRLLE